MPRWVQPSDVLIQQFAGESVVLKLSSGSYFGLDGVATRMWTVLTTSESTEKALEVLLAEYEVTPDRLRHDIEVFARRLREHGLLELCED